MGRKYDGIIRRIWGLDVARADRIFGFGEHVFLERVK